MNRCVWGEVDREGWTCCKVKVRPGAPLPYCGYDADDPCREPQETCPVFMTHKWDPIGCPHFRGPDQGYGVCRRDVPYPGRAPDCSRETCLGKSVVS